MSTPTIGRIVLFRFDEYHAAKVNLTSQNSPGRWANHVSEGNELPAVIVAVHSDTCVNLRVFIDGDQEMLWATSRMLGDKPGEWRWPTRDGDPS